MIVPWRILALDAIGLSLYGYNAVRSFYSHSHSISFSHGVVTLVYCSQTDLDVAPLNATLFFHPILWMAAAVVAAVVVVLVAYFFFLLYSPFHVRHHKRFAF